MERLAAIFDMVDFAPDVRCPVIIGLGLRDCGTGSSPSIDVIALQERALKLA
ncbi:MAG: hypothetical protein NTY19_25150 [Planctomycetota bacterium]|nr:hypothetical protein [Planctomycetota bacterium]